MARSSGNPDSLALAPGNLQTARDGGTRNECIERAFYVTKIREPDEVAGSVEADQVPHPRKRRDVGDRVFASHDPGAIREASVEHTEQALRLAGIAVARALVLEILAGELVEEADLAEHRADPSHL